MPGHCFWEKTRNGCRDEADRFKFNAYDFYALCRTAKQVYAEFQCKQVPAKLAAGQCKKRDEKIGAKGKYKQESSSSKADEYESKYHDYYYLRKTTNQKYCFDCKLST